MKKHEIDLQLFNDEELTEEDFEEHGEPESKEEEQKRQKNAEEARKRREREQQEAIEKAKKEAYEKGLAEGKKGSFKTNTFTNEPIEDELDMSDFELMLKLKEEGKDPIKDFRKAKASIERAKKAEKTKKEEEAKTKEEKIKAKQNEEKEDRIAFAKKVGGSKKALEIFQDKNFITFSKGRIGNEPLTDIYDDYVSFVKTFGGDKETPSLPSSGGSGESKTKSTKKMTLAEHEEYMRRKYHS